MTYYQLYILCYVIDSIVSTFLRCDDPFLPHQRAATNQSDSTCEIGTRRDASPAEECLDFLRYARGILSETELAYARGGA